jgi:hypothetical protein
MTVPLQTRRSPLHLGNGVADSFAFSFKVFSSADVAVTTADAAGVETERALNTDYTVSVNADQDATPGGTITYPITGTKLQTGERLIIEGNAVASQLTDLQSYGFYPQSVEDMIDKLTMILQQLATDLSRTMSLPPTAYDTTSAVLPAPEANKLLGWDTSATNLVNKAFLLTGGLIVSAFIETLLDDVDASAARATLGAAASNAPTITGTTSLQDLAVGGTSVTNYLTVALGAAIAGLTATGAVLTRPVVGSIHENISVANVTGAQAINVNPQNYFAFTLTGNTTFSFSGVPSTGVALAVTVELIQGGAGSYTVTWPGTIKWAGGVAPTLTTTVGKTDVITLVTRDGGTSWLGFVAGQNL